MPETHFQKGREKRQDVNRQSSRKRIAPTSTTMAHLISEANRIFHEPEQKDAMSPLIKLEDEINEACDMLRCLEMA